jgi:short-subunit dehydrogenase
VSRLEPYRFAGRTAVLTGAAAGMGEKMAHGLAARGSDLVLIDRDAPRLASVAGAVRAAHPARRVTEVELDLTDRDALAAADLGTGEVGLLINNAGVALGGRFTQVTAEEFEWVMAINFTAPVLLTRRLLPRIGAGGHLVNVSSVFGLFAPPGQTAYSASKFALRGFSESLAGELAPKRIGVTTVYPGGIRTRIAANARMGSGVDPDEARRGLAAFQKLLQYPPEKAAEEILHGVRRRRPRVLISTTAKTPDLIARLLPSSHGRVVAALTDAASKR